jgi:hypothetical protein
MSCLLMARSNTIQRPAGAAVAVAASRTRRLAEEAAR